MSETSVKNQNVELTPEELEARKAEMLDFYKEQTEFMSVQMEFEKLSADIEEHRLRRLVALVRQAQLSNPAPEEEEEEPKNNQSKKKLKTV